MKGYRLSGHKVNAFKAFIVLDEQRNLVLCFKSRTNIISILMLICWKAKAMNIFNKSFYR